MVSDSPEGWAQGWGSSEGDPLEGVRLGVRRLKRRQEPRFRQEGLVGAMAVVMGMVQKSFWCRMGKTRCV